MKGSEQTPADFDRIRDLELTKHLDEKYGTKQRPYDEEDDDDEEDEAR